MYKNGFIRRVNQEFLCNSISGKGKLNYSKDKFVQGNFQDNEMKCKIFALFYFAICPDILSNDIRKFIQIKTLNL